MPGFRFLFFLVLIVFTTSFSFCQELYVCAPDLRKVNITSGSCLQVKMPSCINSGGYSIAMFKDTLYVLDTSKDLWRSVIKNDSVIRCTLIKKGLRYYYNSLTVDSAGLLYGAGNANDSLYVIDPRSGAETSLGYLPFMPAGDLTFYQGSLYVASEFPAVGIVKVNVKNPSLSTMYIPIPNRLIYGLVSMAVGCNENKVCAGEVVGGRTNFIELDMKNRTVAATICTVPFIVYDAASTVETGLSGNIVVEEIIQTPQCNNALSSAGLQIKCSSGVGTFTYLLNNSVSNTTGNFTGLVPGTYAVHISSSMGCVKDTIAIINGVDSSVINVEVVNTTCERNTGSITIIASSPAVPFLYSINASPFTRSNNFTGLKQGTYTARISDNNKCISSAVVTVSSTTPPLVQHISISPATCDMANGTISITPSTAITGYSINNSNRQNSGLFTNLVPGDYLISTFALSGCKYDTLVQVSKTSKAIPSLVLVSTAPTCYNINDGKVTVNLTGQYSPYFVSFNSLEFNTRFSYQNLSSGTYNIRIRDSQNCITDTIAVVPDFVKRPIINTIVSQPPTCWLPNAGSIELKVSGQLSPYMITYSNLTNAAPFKFTNLASGMHRFEIFDKNHCLIDSIHHTLILQTTGICDTLMVPNAFTPNKDQVNDYFMSKALGLITNYSISVYNRYGQLVFSNTDINAGWDGKYNKTDQPSGTFVWKTSYSLPDGKRRFLKGTVVLSR